jgi:hypothetical protein
MTERPPQVRGLSLQHWLDAYERVYGAARATGVRQHLPAEVRSALHVGLEPEAWYPLGWYRQALALGREHAGDGLPAIERVARVAAASEFSGIHRVLVLFVSPMRLLRHAGRVFGRYYSHGSVTTVARGTHAAEVHWQGCAGFDENLWHDTLAATAVICEICGGKDVQREVVRGAGHHDEHAAVVYRWR